MADVTDISFDAPRLTFRDDFPDALGGHIEHFDLKFGISGWALNFNAPEEVLKIEMIVEGHVVGECRTLIKRDDVTANIAQEASPGFRFSDSDIAKLSRIAALCRDDTVSFRISGTTVYLSCKEDAPFLARLFPTRSVNLELSEPLDFDLSTRLSDLRGRATSLTTQALRPLPERLAGFIEALSIDENGCVWISGWMRPLGPVDCQAVVVNLQKVPAGFAFSFFDRADLPAGCYGLIGILLTNWRPAQGSEFHIYLGQHGDFLHGTQAVRIMPFPEFGENFLPPLLNAHTGHTISLQRMLSRPDNWNVITNVEFPVHASVDQVFVLPGFGVLISGWVVSPMREVVAFGLRMGTAVLESDRAKFFHKSRPDLAAAFPNNDEALRNAGFVAVFRGNLLPTDLFSPVLKVVYRDGSSSNHNIDRRMLCRLTEETGLQAARALFPSLTSELFFADFAAAMIESLQVKTRDCSPYMISQAKQVLVFVIPDDRSDLFILLTMIDQQLRTNPAPPGVAFISSTGRNRAEIVELFSIMSVGSSVQYSLFLMDDPNYALYGLPKVLALLGASSFAFIAAGIYPTEAGWRAILDALADNRPGLELLEIEDPASSRLHPQLTAQCFAWSSFAFALWLQKIPVFLNGFHGDNGISDATDDVRVHHAAAHRSFLPRSAPLITAINSLARAS